VRFCKIMEGDICVRELDYLRLSEKGKMEREKERIEKVDRDRKKIDSKKQG